MADQVEQTIRANAAAPKHVQIDGQTVTQRSMGELIEADRYLASKAAVAKSHRGLRFTKVVAPGARMGLFGGKTKRLAQGIMVLSHRAVWQLFSRPRRRLLPGDRVDELAAAVLGDSAAEGGSARRPSPPADRVQAAPRGEVSRDGLSDRREAG